jgi:hypothetical protein
MGCCIKTGGRTDTIGGAIESKHGASHHGVHELKMNYKISADTKVLGAGSFGKVFLS